MFGFTQSLCASVCPQYSGALRFLVWQGIPDCERLVLRRKTLSCRTCVPLAMHVKDLSTVGNRRRVGEVRRCAEKIHRFPWHHDRLTSKLQTPGRVGSATLLAACLSQERQNPNFPRMGNKVVKMKKEKKEKEKKSERLTSLSLQCFALQHSGRLCANHRGEVRLTSLSLQCFACSIQDAFVRITVERLGSLSLQCFALQQSGRPCANHRGEVTVSVTTVLCFAAFRMPLCESPWRG